MQQPPSLTAAPDSVAPVMISETQKVTLKNNKFPLSLQPSQSINIDSEDEMPMTDMTPESSMYVPGTVLKFEDEQDEEDGEEDYDKLGLMNDGMEGEGEDSSSIQISNVQSQSKSLGIDNSMKICTEYCFMKTTN